MAASISRRGNEEWNGVSEKWQGETALRGLMLSPSQLRLVDSSRCPLPWPPGWRR